MQRYPLSFAHHLLAYLEMFQRDRESLKNKDQELIPPIRATLAGTKIK